MFEIAILSASSLINSLLGLTVYLKNPKSATNKLFLVLTTSFVAWSIINYISLHPIFFSQIVWVRLVLFSAAFLCLSVFLTFTVFPSYKWTGSSTFRKIALIATILVMAFTLSPYVFTEGDNNIPTAGPGIPVFAVLVLSLLGSGIFMLITKYRKSKGIQRRQLGFVLFGLSGSFGLILLTNFLAVVIFKYTNLLIFGSAYTLIFSGALAYAIFRYRLFDIRLAIARSLTYVFVLLSLVILYATMVFGVIRLFFQGESLSIGQTYVYTISAVFLAFTYGPLKKFFDRVTERIFFRNDYDSQVVLDALGNVTANEIQLRRLSIKSMQILHEALKTKFISLYVISAAREFEPYTFHVGDNPKHPIGEMEIGLFEAMGDAKEEVIIAERLNESKIKLQQTMNAADISIAARLETSHELVGFLCFGPKQNGSMYDTKDGEVLSTAADELALAIQNSLRFQEIQDFNETLQARVNEATKELKESNKKLHALDIAKDEFISMASHQLRTPLTTVKGYLSIVLEDSKSGLAPKQRKMLEQAYAGSQRMAYLIGDFLNVSRLQTGKFVLEIGKVNLANLVAEEIAQLKETAASRQLKFNYSQPDNFPVIQADETKLRQVIMNFIDNAIFYSRSDDEITVELLATEKEIVFKVRDHGIGVPAAERPHLFTKFYRASNARKVRPDGTGIGLFMAKKVVVAHGGSIIFETTEGKGSTFGFRLPRPR